MTKDQIINYLIKKYNYKTYLEIGVANGYNLNRIQCEIKDSADPYFQDNYNKDEIKPAKYHLTSDDFFEQIAPTLDYKYDIIFIDGLHITEQVDKDIKNSFKYLNQNGIIIVHDCVPRSYEAQLVPRIQSTWNGNVWKSIVKLRMQAANLYITVIDTDEGCGLLKRNEDFIMYKPDFDGDVFDYNIFNEHKKELLNLISVEEFLNTF